MKARKKPGRIRAAILEWFGVGMFSSDAASSDAGETVTDRRMLTLSAVWACARLISETIATLPLSLMERTPAGKQVASTHPLYAILHDQPNADSTASVFWEAVVATMLLRGNARAEKLMIGNRLVGLGFLHPDCLTRIRLGDGKYEYRYTEANGKQRAIPENRVWTIPGWSLDGKCGVSVIQYGANVFGASIAADRAASGLFSRGLMPTVWFKYPKVLRADQRQEARELIEGRLSGAVNSGRPAILEADMEVGTIGINPKDAQLIESRAFGVEEICRWFRVDPSMVGHGAKDSNWGTGLEQKMIWFLTFTVAPWLRRIEQAISKDLLTPVERKRYYAKFSVEGLLRADSAGRSEFYSSMVNNGIMTRDEVRELEDREPMGGNAAVLTVQTALTPLDRLGEEIT